MYFSKSRHKAAYCHNIPTRFPVRRVLNNPRAYTPLKLLEVTFLKGNKLNITDTQEGSAEAGILGAGVTRMSVAIYSAPKWQGTC